MTQARKLFSQTISVSGNLVQSVGSIMETAGWGFGLNSDGTINTAELSADSTIGTGLTIFPQTSTIWVGEDQFVRDVASVGPPRYYKGVTASPLVPYAVEDFHKGALVDIYQVWLYFPGV